MLPHSGHYCPEASYEATPCPAGTYRNIEEGMSLADCTPCPVNTHNPYIAQQFCYMCGGEASQPSTGGTTCICNGAGRDYQV